MEWISVKDRLPNPEINVLAMDSEGEMHVAFRTELWDAYVKNAIKWTYYDYLPWIDITHWMPLPAPPITLPEPANQSTDPVDHIPGSTKMMDHIVDADKKVVE